MSDNALDRLHFRLAGVIHELRERFPFPKTGERQLKIVGVFVDRVGAELQDIDNTLYRLAQDRSGMPEPEYVPESSRERCSRCGEPLNNVSPGFGIRDGKLVCMPCLNASGQKPQLLARSL